MTLPTTRVEWQMRQKQFAGMPKLRRSEKKVLKGNATWLLERLYEPHGELGYRLTRIEDVLPDGVLSEPINWGDLNAFVEKQGKAWRITLEEASPDTCPNLCAYVADWLRKWGWDNILVETEW